ncbi:TonB-linked outer membrane protein, SusC/RagA family [Catalinimonas alkaloidigena]|uniref:TonB-linked outer membrane protein, SusC/RagA family n=1 Tax=Catalinimonas alkaloidigena TaxID=1075417 RepID=A0A1G9ALY9_9BACT|nr:TonB-dependent receptor [Catalinimonas alkaloidigena]SDK28389.1 TonB-linked outer membrane protein, SusC/RagA family [Catalinimonas alkaloidigena]
MVAFCLLALLLPLGATIAQTTTYRVNGKVTSQTDSEGIPGVNIIIKGTTTGTTTSFDGTYSIQLKEGDVLVFSSIGYVNQEVNPNGQSELNIQLAEDVAMLQDVVVVGYGEMKRSDISSAQTTIDSKSIQKTVNTTIDQAIQGRAAGVYVTQNTGQPGGGVSVNIRGVNSLTGSNEPLYVIDGVQVQPGTVSYGSTSSVNPLAGLNPADIASMEILQGPSATAIYGSRGTNGVVLITTKRGQAGETKVSYGFLYSLQDKPQELPSMNLQQYAQMYNEIRTLRGETAPIEFRDPSILGAGTNWQDALFKTAPLMKHQVSLSGGSEKTTFYLSGEYFDQEGVAIGSSFDRYSVRVNVDNQTRKWLKLGMNLNVNQTNEQLASTQENVILNALQLAPNIPVRNPDGTWGGADAANGQSVQFTPLNPVAIANLISNTLMRRQVLGGFNVDINILKGLTFRTTLNGNIQYSDGRYFIPTYQLGLKSNDVASLSVTSDNSLYWNWNQLLEYKTTIGKHDIGAMISHEAQESRWQQITGSRTGFLSNDVVDLPLGNQQSANNGGGRSQWAMESYFGRLNYTFNSRYIVQAALRADGSANFGPENRWGVFPSASAAWRVSEESFMQSIPVINDLKIRYETGLTGNQGNGSYIYGPLASVTTPWGPGFRLSRYGNPYLQWESTMTNNIGFNLSLFQSRIQLEGDFYVKQTENLLLENPLPDYMGTAGEGAIGRPWVNIGAMQNRGWAFTLNTINIDNGNFSWNSNFNISGNKAKVTEFYSETASLNRIAWYMNNWNQRSVVGQAPWQFYGYVQEGIFQSVDEINNSAIPADNNGNRREVAPGSIWVGDVKYKDLNGDNIIDERDQTFIGNPWPKFTIGFTNTFAYKGFDLSILLTGVYGNDVYNYLRFIQTNPNNINLGRNLFEETFNYARVEGEGTAAQVTNPGTNIPRITTATVNGQGEYFTDYFVEDGSFLRVKNIQLGYNLPQTLMAKQSVLQSVRLTAGIQNLYTLTKYKGYDPEVGAYVGRDVDTNSQSIGLDYGRYPLTPVYTFGINADF